VRAHVRVPATSANLGPGFDALGLALALHNEVVAEERDGVTVTIVGEGADRLARDGANVVARGVKLAYEAAGRPFKGCALECVNRIPAARGLGSSAAAWVGGLVAGNALLGSPLSRDALLALAASAEGHPDNVAAAIFGGLTVSCATAEGVTAVTLPVTKSLAWVVLVPEVTSATAEARALLPRSVPREDAVFNVQRVALLLAGLQTSRPAALAVALDDRLHQP
jgi:homoserine kinase